MVAFGPPCSSRDAGGGLIISRHTKRWNSGRSEGMFPTTRVVELSWLALRGSPGSTDRFQPVCLFVPRQCFSARVQGVWQLPVQPESSTSSSSRNSTRPPRPKSNLSSLSLFFSFFFFRNQLHSRITSDRSLTQIDRDGESNVSKGEGRGTEKGIVTIMIKL